MIRLEDIRKHVFVDNYHVNPPPFKQLELFAVQLLQYSTALYHHDRNEFTIRFTWCIFVCLHNSASLLACSLLESPAPEKSWMRMTAISTDLCLQQSEWNEIFSPSVVSMSLRRVLLSNWLLILSGCFMSLQEWPNVRLFFCEFLFFLAKSEEKCSHWLYSLKDSFV